MTGYGGVLAFSLKGGFENAKTFLNWLQYAHLAASLGSGDTLVGPPQVTSHVEATEEERKQLGIPEGLIRCSVGIENAEDLIADLKTPWQLWSKNFDNCFNWKNFTYSFTRNYL